MNTKKLKSVIVLNGFTQIELAKKLGISEQSLSAKINGRGAEFKQSEICKMVKLLNLNEKDITDIFFDKSVSKKDTKI